jgi:uncharacterized protein with FMN-binding domain
MLKNIVWGVLVLIVAAGIVGVIKLIRYKQRVKNLTIGPVDLARVADGTYEGFYDLDLVKARMAVTVRDHKIVDVKIVKHDHGRGAKAEAVSNEIVKKQTPVVDAVTGATASSKAIMKAAEDALKKAAEIRP